MRPEDYTISTLQERIKRRETSVTDLISAFIKRIERLNPEYHAFITVMKDEALGAARRADEEIKSGVYRGPLHGIPYAVKDLFFTRGVATTCGSHILRDFIPACDATVIKKLEEAGAIILGKLNMHEFAYGPTSINPYYGTVKNPWNKECIAGGSSGGSAAAVAASMTVFSLGSDTGGSVRIPAACCGVVGLKPTYGRVSVYGVYPLCWSMDHVGIMGKCVTDVACVLKAIAGKDRKDTASASREVPDYAAALTGDAKGLRVGILLNYCEVLDEEVRSKVSDTIHAFKGLGVQVEEVMIPDIEDMEAATSVTLITEAMSCLEEFYQNRPHELGADVRDRLALGAHFDAASYIKAQRVRRYFREKFSWPLV